MSLLKEVCLPDLLCGLSMMDYPETSGNLRKPPETSGNLRKPPETSLWKPSSGNLPPETSLRKPPSGNLPPETYLRKPTSGNLPPETYLRKPPETSGNLRKPLETFRKTKSEKQYNTREFILFSTI
jgi:hypothetical protein